MEKDDVLGEFINYKDSKVARFSSPLEEGDSLEDFLIYLNSKVDQGMEVSLTSEMLDYLITEVQSREENKRDLVNLMDPQLSSQLVGEVHKETLVFKDLEVLDVVLLSSEGEESLMVVVKNIIDEENIVGYPIVDETDLATNLSHIIHEKNTNFLRSDLAILQEFEVYFSFDSIANDGYLGLVKEESFQAQKRGFSIVSPRDSRDIGRARLIQLVNHYSHKKPSVQKKEEKILNRHLKRSIPELKDLMQLEQKEKEDKYA